MTREEAMKLIDAWERDPDGVRTCDNLCTVADALGLSEGQYSPEELRVYIAETLDSTQRH